MAGDEGQHSTTFTSPSSALQATPSCSQEEDNCIVEPQPSVPGLAANCRAGRLLAVQASPHAKAYDSASPAPITPPACSDSRTCISSKATSLPSKHTHFNNSAASPLKSLDCAAAPSLLPEPGGTGKQENTLLQALLHLCGQVGHEWLSKNQDLQSLVGHGCGSGSRMYTEAVSGC